MTPGHYIVGMGSYNTPFDFPKDTERNFKSETKIFRSRRADSGLARNIRSEKY